MSTPISPILQKHFAAHFDAATRWEDLQSAPSSHRVYRAGGKDPQILKIFSHPSAFQRERHALQQYGPHLPRCPKWIDGHDQDPWAILMSLCSGHPVEDLSLPLRLPPVPQKPKTDPPLPDPPRPDEENSRLEAPILDELVAKQFAPILKQAGQWLQRLHHIPVVDEDPLAPKAALQQRKQSALASAAQLGLPKSLVRWLENSDLRPFAAPRVPCHRDFSPRNWLWDASKQELWVLDFEHCRPDLPAWDLLRFAEHPWGRHAKLIEAFTSGYPAAQKWLQNPAWPALRGIHAIHTLAWAQRHDDFRLVQNAQSYLEQIQKQIGELPG